jgi:DNA-binding transcriptional ArsR family regulator
MDAEPNVALIASLLADPTRARFVTVLMNGRAVTAKELAYGAGVTPQTASAHLAKLLSAGMLSVVAQGRHRYYRLQGPAVAAMVESIMEVAPAAPKGRSVGDKKLDEIRFARTCYDHLAGRLGVAVAQALVDRKVVRAVANDFLLSRKGRAFLLDLGVDIDKAERARRVFSRQCLDWSERRAHIGGALGAAIADRLLRLGWLEKRSGGRALRVTTAGRRGLVKTFKLDIERL